MGETDAAVSPPVKYFIKYIIYTYYRYFNKELAQGTLLPGFCILGVHGFELPHMGPTSIPSNSDLRGAQCLTSFLV